MPRGDGGAYIWINRTLTRNRLPRHCDAPDHHQGNGDVSYIADRSMCTKLRADGLTTCTPLTRTLLWEIRIAKAILHGRVARMKRCWPDFNICTSTILSDSQRLNWIVLCVLLFKDECKYNVYNKQEAQEMIGTKRGYYVVSEISWAHAHAPWMTEWARLHGHPRLFVGLFTPSARLWGQLRPTCSHQEDI